MGQFGPNVTSEPDDDLEMLSENAGYFQPTGDSPRFCWYTHFLYVDGMFCPLHPSFSAYLDISE